jgi:hypothetical protein
MTRLKPLAADQLTEVGGPNSVRQFGLAYVSLHCKIIANKARERDLRHEIALLAS